MRSTSLFLLDPCGLCSPGLVNCEKGVSGQLIGDLFQLNEKQVEDVHGWNSIFHEKKWRFRGNTG